MKRFLKFILPWGLIDLVKNRRTLRALGRRLSPTEIFKSDLVALDAVHSGLALFAPGHAGKLRNVVDVGANVGQWSGMLLNCVTPEKLVIIEPLPDAFEVRLLLAQDFSDNVEWAANFFFEQEIGGDRGREVGFAQSIMFPIILPRERLKVGAEMQFTSFTDAGIREAGETPSYRVVIGPTIAWKPSKNTRLDISPLFGVTDDAPRASVFVVFSMLFGPGGERPEAEAPASTRNR